MFLVANSDLKGTIEFSEGTMNLEEAEQYVGKYCVINNQDNLWRVKILGIVNNNVVGFAGKKYHYSLDSIHSISEMNLQEKIFFKDKYER